MPNCRGEWRRAPLWIRLWIVSMVWVAGSWVVGVGAIEAASASDTSYLCYNVQAESGSICAKGTPREGARCETDADCGPGSCSENKYPSGSIRVSDPFDGRYVANLDTKQVASLCAPVLEGGGTGEGEQRGFLSGRHVTRAKGEGRLAKSFVAKNEFGTVPHTTKKSRKLLLPTRLGMDSPVPASAEDGLDEFICYSIRYKYMGWQDQPQLGKQLSVEDRLGKHEIALGKATHLCNGMSITGRTVGNDGAHVLCYAALAPPGVEDLELRRPIAGLHTNSFFGPQIIRTLGPSELCIPTTVTPLSEPPEANRYPKKDPNRD